NPQVAGSSPAGRTTPTLSFSTTNSPAEFVLEDNSEPVEYDVRLNDNQGLGGIWAWREQSRADRRDCTGSGVTETLISKINAIRPYLPPPRKGGLQNAMNRHNYLPLTTMVHDPARLSRAERSRKGVGHGWQLGLKGPRTARGSSIL